MNTVILFLPDSKLYSSRNSSIFKHILYVITGICRFSLINMVNQYSSAEGSSNACYLVIPDAPVQHLNSFKSSKLFPEFFGHYAPLLFKFSSISLSNQSSCILKLTNLYHKCHLENNIYNFHLQLVLYSSGRFFSLHLIWFKCARGVVHHSNIH